MNWAAADPGSDTDDKPCANSQRSFFPPSGGMFRRVGVARKRLAHLTGFVELSPIEGGTSGASDAEVI